MLLLIFLAALVFVCMCAGPTGAGSLHVMKGILSASLEPPDKNIIYSLRLPRILLVGVVGAALFLAGVVFQAVLRNPLAEPYVLGVSGGAAVGAFIGILAGAPTMPFGLPELAFLGSHADRRSGIRNCQNGEERSDPTRLSCRV